MKCTYRRFADRLLKIYNAAKRIKANGRLLNSTRAERVAELNDEILELCADRWLDEDTDGRNRSPGRASTASI